MAAPKKPAGSARVAASIPQVAWHQIRSAPVILVTGPEDFLAERANRLLRDALRERDAAASLRVIELAQLDDRARRAVAGGVEMGQTDMVAPAIDTIDDEWCGARYGARRISPAFGDSSCTDECTIVVEIASSSVRGGNKPTSRSANIVLPAPGGPTNNK